MNKNYLKILSSFTITALFLIVAFGSGESKSTKSSGSESNNSERNTNSSSNSEVRSNSSSYDVCSECGKRLSDTWYSHLGKMVDCFSTSNPKEGIGKWCSQGCCTKARMRSCPSCYK